MRDDAGNSSPRTVFDSRALTLAVATALVVLAWLIYRPDRLRPFHILDFSEFIPILLTGNGFVDGTRSVVEYYASQGRFNAIPYVLLAIKWDLFAWWTPGWQIARAVTMIGLFALTYFLLRRLGASRLGGLIGGSVYFWSPSAGDGWVRMTIAEPLGAAIMLGLAIRAVRYQAAERWPREVVFMALGTIGLLWTKELMAPLLILPVGLAWSRNHMVPSRGQTRRNVALVTAVAIAAVLAILPIAILYLRAEEAAYASMYGRGMQSLSGIIAIWITMLVPFELIIVPANVVWALAVAGFALLLPLGWRAGLRDAENSGRAPWLLAVALIVPLAGVLAYLPNPWYANFYTLPYLIGAALLTGMASTWLQAAMPSGATIATAAWLAIVAHSATTSANYAARTDAVQRRDEWVIAFVADSADADSVQFATMRPPPYDWLGFGAAMTRISTAKGHPWPPTRNVSCDDARTALGSRTGLVTVNFESSCKFKAPRMKVISQPFHRLDMRRLRVVVDSAHADIVLPAVDSRSP
jgi:hypothetical protein